MGDQTQNIEGPIGYFGLADWWLATFTEAERKYIDATTESPTGGGPLTKGHISFSSGTAAQLLSALATNFYKPPDRRIARLMLAKAEELAKAAGNTLDLHYTYMGMIKTYYSDRDTDPAALDATISACERQIDIAPEAAQAWSLEYPNEPLPAHTGFTQLAVIREKQKDHAEAVRLLRLAMEQQWAGDWDGRITRNQKRLAEH